VREDGEGEEGDCFLNTSESLGKTLMTMTRAQNLFHAFKISFTFQNNVTMRSWVVVKGELV